MKFTDYLKQKKPLIDKEILLFLKRQRKEYASAGHFSKDVFEKLEKFVVGGKSFLPVRLIILAMQSSSLTELTFLLRKLLE